MESIMPEVRVREKRQITLPASVSRAANLDTNDILNVTYRNGVISLVVKKTEKKRGSLMALMGSAKGLYGNTAAETDAYLINERASWER
jgi:bifunctional DNA-binding transcriptional regulator/antitoxin component of YhaV-PrlF toxin-antitoxin module